MGIPDLLNIHWKGWCWSWNSSTLATWCKELTHWQRPWCRETLKAGGEGDDRGWDGWMASLTQWTWVWVNSKSWWWTGKPGVLQSLVSQRVRHDWEISLNWLSLMPCKEQTCKNNSWMNEWMNKWGSPFTEEGRGVSLFSSSMFYKRKSFWHV